MMLRPESTNEPFGPIMMTRDARSATPGDFAEGDLALLSEILREVDDVWLRARLADLLWLLETPRDPKKALIAIDSYRAIPLDEETWLHGGQDCWRRAIVLARMLKRGAGDRLAEITLVQDSV
jgi:hypothetical protein